MDELNIHIKKFISSKIDEIVDNNPMLAIFSARIKRGINAVIDEKLKAGSFINAFILDENGKLDASLYDEVSKMFDEMPMQNFTLMDGFAEAAVGRGRVEIMLRKNMFTSMLMPNSGKITFTKDDLKEFFDLAKTITTKK